MSSWVPSGTLPLQLCTIPSNTEMCGALLTQPSEKSFERHQKFGLASIDTLVWSSCDWRVCCQADVGQQTAVGSVAFAVIFLVVDSADEGNQFLFCFGDSNP